MEESPVRLPEGVRSIFFIGIGGISMSSMAFLSQKSGYEVSGSDRGESEMIERLKKAGIRVERGHDASHLGNAQLVVYTAAVGEDNPELIAAKERGIPCRKRAEFLGGILAEYRKKIGVCGMHGKSTTTSLLSHIFLSLSLDPSIIAGAEIPEIGGAFRVGGNEWMLFESDEYKAAFHSFPTDIAVCLNAEMDHVDFYHSIEDVIEAFRVYIRRAPTAVVHADDENLLRAREGYEGRLITFSLTDPSADLFASEILLEPDSSSYTLFLHGEKLCRVTLPLTGPHYVFDSLAALGGAYAAGLSLPEAAKTLIDFGGTHRRSEYRGEFNGVVVYDDYAHHPSEIRASLKGFRAKKKKIFCVFQPHTYSRTKGLFDGFVSAFSDADEVIFADIFAAREQNTFGVSSAMLAEKTKNARYFDSFEKIAAYLREAAKPGDLVITMGAGDVRRVGDLLLRN